MAIKLLLLSILLSISSLAAADDKSDIAHAIGQMMIVGFNGTQVNENSPIVKEIKRYHIGGVILDNHRQLDAKHFSTNVTSPTQLKNLTQQLQFYAKKYHDYPLFISINQEGGLINTLKVMHGFHNADDPSQFTLGKSKDQNLIFNKTYERGLLLKQVGINLNLAPVADLNINPTNPAIGKWQRSFGVDLQQVTQDLKTAISAYKKAKMLCTLKHFPGLGSAKKNTDYDNADVTDSWHTNELLPYQNLIQSNTVCPFIMTTHLINRQLDENGLPASLSKKVVTDLLVNKLHYKGIIMTDDMDAAAIRKNIQPELAIEKAVYAGNDIIIYGGTQGYDPDEDTHLLFATLQRLAAQNPEIRANILKSYHKIIAFKKTIAS